MNAVEMSDWFLCNPQSQWLKCSLVSAPAFVGFNRQKTVGEKDSAPNLRDSVFCLHRGSCYVEHTHVRTHQPPPRHTPPHQLEDFRVYRPFVGKEVKSKIPDLPTHFMFYFRTFEMVSKRKEEKRSMGKGSVSKGMGCLYRKGENG